MEAYYSQTSRIADGAGKLGVAYPLHATLHDGYYPSLLGSCDGVGAAGCIPLMPSARVSSVLKGMLNIWRVICRVVEADVQVRESSQRLHDSHLVEAPSATGRCWRSALALWRCRGAEVNR